MTLYLAYQSAIRSITRPQQKHVLIPDWPGTGSCPGAVSFEKMPPPGWFQKVLRIRVLLSTASFPAKAGGCCEGLVTNGYNRQDAERRGVGVRSPKVAGEVTGPETEADIAIVSIKDVAVCEKDCTHFTSDFPGSVSAPALFSTFFCNSSEGNRRASGLTLI